MSFQRRVKQLGQGNLYFISGTSKLRRIDANSRQRLLQPMHGQQQMLRIGNVFKRLNR